MLSQMRGLAAVALVATLLGCEGVDHDNIDKWRETEKGAGKLEAALASSEHDADMRAHAAQNLIQIRQYAAVEQRLEAMTDADRSAVVAKLVPRLSQDAEAPEGQAPSILQTNAKDALFEVRGFAADATRDEIDEYLADWLGVNYEDRTRRGRVRGEQILRHVGKRIAPKLLARARTIIATPPDAQGRIPMFSDDLLRGLAYSGSPEAVELLLDMAMKEHPEPTLQRRSMAALYVAYIEDLEEPKLDPAALAAHAGRFAEVIRDGSQEGGNKNDAFALLAAAGEPACTPHFVSLISEPGTAESFLWAAVQKGLVCVGTDGIPTIVEAMPTQWAYERGILEKYLWKKMKKLDPASTVAKQCRALLESKSWVARVTGVECLGMIGNKGDAEAVRALADDKTALKGWWGDQSELPKGERKKPINLGVVAQEVAKKLETM
jgi:hypothetical protein